MDALRTTEVQIVEVDGESYLEAPGITSAVDAAAARELADVLFPRLSGLLRVEAGIRTPLTAGAVVEFDEDGTKHAFVVEHAHASFAATISGQATIDGVPVPATKRPLDFGLEQLGDAHVALVLDVLADKPDWVSLYKVLDVIEDTVGGERALEAKGWVPATSLKRLTLTANAIETAASGGRHATAKFSLARSRLQPLPLDEAWDVVRQLVRSWLMTRA